jgi:hypothetical protein
LATQRCAQASIPNLLGQSRDGHPKSLSPILYRWIPTEQTDVDAVVSLWVGGYIRAEPAPPEQ